MTNEKDFIKKPVVINNTDFSAPYVMGLLAIAKTKENKEKSLFLDLVILKSKLNTFSILIENKEFKNAYDEFFKNYI